MDAQAVRALRLYRTILRLHKAKLPAEMRKLGDAYVREEFKRHKAAKPKFLGSFYAEWTAYVEQLDKAPAHNIGRGLTEADMAALSDEQRGQLNVLREEVAKQMR